MNTKLKQARETSGKTQAELAKAAEITTMSYFRYETGERLPKADIAIRIARELNSTVEELFG